MLKNKTVLLCVTGSIAAYKAAEIASLLGKQNADVYALMTKSATELITPLTLENLTHHRVVSHMFDRHFSYDVEHIALAKKADVVLVAPATANIIAKLAAGIADDMVSTTVLACKCPKIIAPAMNTAMLENPVTQRNLQILSSFGWKILPTDSGTLACGDVGSGKLLPPASIVEEVLYEIACEKDLQGKTVLVSAGPTREAMDPVRYITNHSTGKMGYAIARAAAMRGAQVTLVSGPVNLAPPAHVDFVPVVSAEDMFREITGRSARQDIIIKAAAVADYRPAVVLSEKKKKQEGESPVLALERTKDILAYLGANRRPDQFLCGFAMETEHLMEHAAEKLRRKNVDMICANSLRQEGAGFGSDTNVLTLLTATQTIPLPMDSKEQCAHRILDEIARHFSFGDN